MGNFASCPIRQRWLKAWEQKRAAHFTLITAPLRSIDAESFLQSWQESLLQEIFALERGVASSDNHILHPDIIRITPEESGKKYTEKHPEIIEWLRTKDYLPLEFRYRLILIEDADLLPEEFQNKLLKLLEEPPARNLIMMTRVKPVSLLETVESRALKLILRSTDQGSEKKQTSNDRAPADFCDYLTQLTDSPLSNLAPLLRQKQWHLFIDAMKDGEDSERLLIKTVLEFEALQPASYARKARLLRNLKWFEESQTFNNGSAERWNTVLTDYI